MLGDAEVNTQRKWCLVLPFPLRSRDRPRLPVLPLRSEAVTLCLTRSWSRRELIPLSNVSGAAEGRCCSVWQGDKSVGISQGACGEGALTAAAIARVSVVLSALAGAWWGSASRRRHRPQVCPQSTEHFLSANLSLLVSPLLSRAVLPDCRVVLSGEAALQAVTFCAFSMVGPFHSCPRRVVVPQLAGAGTCSPRGCGGVGLVSDTREFCGSLAALVSPRPALCTQARKAQALPSPWGFRPGTLEQQEHTAVSDLPGSFFGLMNVQ